MSEQTLMAAAEIDRSRWGPYLDSLTNSLIGKQAEIEVVSLDLGDQIEAEWTPLIGVTYDRKDDLIEIALEDLDHLIRSPRQLFIDYAVGGAIAAIQIIDADGNQQIVRFKDPLALPAPEDARGVAAG
jgi:Family of unknown function (DUF5335)